MKYATFLYCENKLMFIDRSLNIEQLKRNPQGCATAIAKALIYQNRRTLENGYVCTDFEIVNLTASWGKRLDGKTKIAPKVLWRGELNRAEVSKGSR